EGGREEGGFDGFDEGKDGPIKGDDEYLVKHGSGAHFLDDRLGDVGVATICAITPAGLDFDIDLNMAPGEVEDFTQGGYLLWFRPSTWEVGSGIEAAQVGEIEVEDVAMPVGELVPQQIPTLREVLDLDRKSTRLNSSHV